MPNYEYKCQSCENEWEETQSIKAPATEECPKCKAKTAKRLISKGLGFRLEGQGWARDGYRLASSLNTPS